MVSMGLRAISVSPENVAGTAAATYNWMPKSTQATLETLPGYDIPRLLVYSHAVQREADPTFIYAVAKGTSFLDEFAGLPLCGLAGQPTGSGPYVWSPGLAGTDPTTLTVTHVYGVPTADQLIGGICTLWQVTVDPASGRNMVEWEIIGTPVTPIAAPTPSIPTSTVQRAGQTVVTRNTVATKLLSYQIKLTQPSDPLYTTPTASGSEVFVLPDEQETDGVLGELSVVWKYLAYSGSSLEAARTATTEAFVATATRGTAIIIITTPTVQNTKAAPDDSKPRQRQALQGPILYNSGIGALCTVSIAGGSITYAKS